MEGILIFFVVMSVILFLMRFAASKLYDYNHPEEKTVIQKFKEFESAIVSEQIKIEDDDELIAVISAAAFSVLNQKVKIKKISFLSDSTKSDWARAGRANVMSHSVPHR